MINFEEPNIHIKDISFAPFGKYTKSRTNQYKPFYIVKN